MNEELKQQLWDGINNNTEQKITGVLDEAVELIKADLPITIVESRSYLLPLLYQIHAIYEDDNARPIQVSLLPHTLSCNLRPEGTPIEFTIVEKVTLGPYNGNHAGRILTPLQEGVYTATESLDDLTKNAEGGDLLSAVCGLVCQDVSKLSELTVMDIKKKLEEFNTLTDDYGEKMGKELERLAGVKQAQVDTFKELIASVAAEIGELE